MREERRKEATGQDRRPMGATDKSDAPRCAFARITPSRKGRINDLKSNRLEQPNEQILSIIHCQISII